MGVYENKQRLGNMSVIKELKAESKELAEFKNHYAQAEKQE